MESLDFNPVTSRKADWNEDRSQLLQLRTTCQLEPVSALDPTSLHFIATCNQEAKSAVAITEDGEIYSIALPASSSIEEHAKPLFRFILKELPRRGYTQVYVNADTIHLHWLKSFGFQLAEDENRYRLFLSPDRTHIASGSELILLDKEEAFQNQVVQLIHRARKQVIIVTPDLEPAIYNNGPVHDGMLALLKYSDKSRVRILAKDTRHLLEINHCLVRLYQRSAMQRIEIKRLSEVPDNFTEAYLISDDCGIVYRQNENHYRGICYHDNRPRVKNQIEAFEILWNVAVDDPNLKRLTI